MSNESIKSPATSNNSLFSELSYVGNKIRVEFDGSCLKQDKLTFPHGSIMNIYIVYKINLWDRGYDDYPTENFLFGAVKLIKNANIEKCKYLVFGIRMTDVELFQ